MKVSFLTENVTNYLSLINKILPNNSQVPILSNVLLVADSSGLLIKATDMELGAEIKIPAKTEIEGTITVPGKEFIEVLNSFPKDKVSLELKEEKVVVSCRGNKVSFNTISGKEYPEIYKEKGIRVATFSWDEFKDIFSYLTFCVSQEETRPQLTGVYIHQKSDILNFVSTDGYRMSVMSIPSGNRKIDEGLIVSVDLINEVLALKGLGEVVLSINKAENHIAFEVGDVLLIGRMIGGSFPDYEKVIPEDGKTKVVFDREQMLQNVKISSVFARDASNILKIDIKDGNMTLSTATQGVGEGESVVEVRLEGDDGKISFNVKYLQDLVKVLAEKEVELKLNSPSEPALFEVKGKNFKHVIMPIQAD